MNATTSRTTSAPTISLRTRVQLQCACYDAIAQFPDQQDTVALMQAQAMKAIQNTASRTMQRTAPQRATVTQLHSTIQRYAMQRDAALAQAKNNLATANHIRNNANAKLGGALQSLAMSDMNSLRAKNATTKQLSVIAEYSNLGSFWG